jgi:hypothetical protein
MSFTLIDWKTGRTTLVLMTDLNPLYLGYSFNQFVTKTTLEEMKCAQIMNIQMRQNETEDVCLLINEKMLAKCQEKKLEPDSNPKGDIE